MRSLINLCFFLSVAPENKFSEQGKKYEREEK